MSVQILQESAPGRPVPRGCRSPRDTHVQALSVCLNTVATWIARIGQRWALRELAEEGRLLSDVGLTREQALREAGKPFWRW